MFETVARETKRAAYGIAALPVTLYALAGRRQAPGRLTALLPDAPAGTRRPRYGRAILVSVPAFALALLAWYLLARIATYGVTWTDDDAATSWGGPTLTGAWIVHALCALGMAVPIFAALAPLTRLHARLTS
ncbi:hypothetical protein CFN78_13840 [Amycolatopsis antarctica]|uniref:Uncharacterized protein n=1 Tax=Amycolatopsis antarctica TaxID=1854586 RepID=A0A263D2L1_9PSEU|nr:hypothetical protein [Amycolatopsis antarctica]OZM72703.1 hypothetical protein CFN78_13840 [Amycolatopsis antarctica]